MRIIDAHAHVFEKAAGITKQAPLSPDRNGRMRIGSRLEQFMPPSFEQSNSTVETLLSYMDWAGIEKAILMSNVLYGYTNDYYADAVCKNPQRFKGVAAVNFIKGREAADELQQLYDTTPLIGLKLETDSIFQCTPGRRMTESEYDSVWECVSANHQPVFLHLFRSYELEDAMTLIRRYPGTPFFLCHMGADSCFGRDSNLKNYRGLLDFAEEHQNVYFDTSYVPSYFDEEYPFPSSIAAIMEAYRCVGPERILWATDYPGSLKYATIFQQIDMIKKHCNIPEKEMKLIMGENAERLFFMEE